MNERRPRPRRERPRSFLEWRTLRRWDKLPVDERDRPGYRLKPARVESGLTQGQLAERVGITQQAVSRAESWTSNPTVALMKRWFESCGRRLLLDVGPATPER